MLNFIKNSRAASFITVAIIYILAAALGIIVYTLLPYSFWLNLLIADVAATVFVFIFSLIFKNASVYDPYWSVQPIVIVCAFAIGKELTLSRILVLVAVLIWGMRLTANWAYTFHGLKCEDWRYTMLHGKTGKLYPFVNFTGIHLVPTLVVYGCILPAVFLFESAAGCNTITVIGFLISVFAFTVQGAADIEMHSFRILKNSGKITDNFNRNGLWKYSRHPNYLGELLMWWGVAISVVSVMPQNFFLIAGAFANTCLFLLASIPMADGRQARKEGYDEYKNETRMLLPIKR